MDTNAEAENERTAALIVSPFDALQKHLQSCVEAIALANAFICSRNADQLFACLRYERAQSEGAMHLAPYLDGSHFEAFAMPCGSSKLYSSDADSEAQNAFVQLQGFARAYLEDPGF